MKVSIKEQILFKIRQQKQGWAFSASDLLKEFNRREIDESLSTLANNGDIRRVMRGIYDLPLYSPLLGRFTAPDLNQVAYALARKFNWTIYPDGDTALNYLQLSTQVVSKYIYLSSGISKKYSIDENIIEFKHVSSKYLELNNTNAILVTQAIKALGEINIDNDFIANLSDKFSSKEWTEISKYSSNVPNWIYEIIKKALELAKEKVNG